MDNNYYSALGATIAHAHQFSLASQPLLLYCTVYVSAIARRTALIRGDSIPFFIAQCSTPYSSRSCTVYHYAPVNCMPHYLLYGVGWGI